MDITQHTGDFLCACISCRERGEYIQKQEVGSSVPSYIKTGKVPEKIVIKTNTFKLVKMWEGFDYTFRYVEVKGSG